ncbi:F0F1 ATP synthase subunit epsilon [Aeromicrobium sp. SMF47]|uniref:ATP synthase epsilon chain n=1 Tax=Aeromicrobium yanjiei TaxID=2662028 RepID=A0A5Q2MG35_9ACTN|nr:MULTISPECIES: F0F1 ATP synthase subunit epsilon [Aeromicrobium]MRJ76743.1 F0F1 ATP synthase subunit epsilon [Aeromicrobium yanjiei]MRK01087.1 F0F1 ATP synthase subunit epsilon [Aeromicrobium sp. S22]QGG42114.1 F0F1 ATP synthase subunit epsilon [Aeromicrobium yanjiei]
MAANDSTSSLQIELVAADRVVWSGQAREVIARTVEGDLGVLAGHAPLLSVLVPGVVEIHPLEGEDVVRAAVGEGFLSVADDHVSILSEDAFLASEIDAAAVKSELEAATAAEDADAVLRAEAKLRLVDKAS